jgi:phosphoserine phosphatase RsbU/P
MMVSNVPTSLPDAAALFEEAACGLLLTDPDGTIRIANDTFCAWLGVAREDLVDIRRFPDLLTIGARIFHQTHWGPLLQIQGSVAEVKIDVKRELGPPIPMMLNAVVREHAGRRFHALSLFVADDRLAYERELLLARKRAEELLARQREAQAALSLAQAHLRLALETAGLHVWEVDLQTGERRCEPGVALLLGRRSHEPIDVDTFRAAVHPDDLTGASEAFERAMRDGDTYRWTFRLRGEDGVERTALATARRVGDSTQTGRVVGLLQDITQHAQQRAAAEDRATFAEQMVGIVSHDLRNPLHTIKLGAQVLRLSGLPDKQTRVIESLDRAIHRAERLVDDLLAFTQARIGRGIALHCGEIDLHAVVASCVDELAAAHPDAHLIHRSEGHGTCRLDPDKLYQVIGNLVSNAVAYGATGSPITVTSRVEGDIATLVVHNVGPVIPADAIATLFRPMVRGSHASTRGIGLGLYIVSEIVHAHGGHVAVTSTEADGTAFTAVFGS